MRPDQACSTPSTVQDPRSGDRAQRVYAVQLVDDLIRGKVEFTWILLEVQRGNITSKDFARAVEFFAAP